MIDNKKWLGEYEITVTNTQTGEVTKERVKNRLLDAGLNAIIGALMDTPVNASIKYLAVGSSNIATTDGMTTLGAEFFRKDTTVNPVSSGLGQITTEFVILDTEANTNTIREVGIFCGLGATGGANTGILMSRILWNKTKTNQEQINFKRTDTIGRA